ncbi:MAG: DNA-binding protein [Planctomycetota bacterium]|nr:MAG: DNA-binding protein [Planctomycetota bacterium]REJ87757.1 MAG: DNA-binding protein [Planctomycetota bacterium]REK27840.1 MAG: DNA-binding protein [Planctomycetota bacterium]REK40294.1 MAG: DNA-binding protein [Planctomycetota bacterium]
MTAFKCLTPPELAAEWRCKSERVLELIRSGELRAFTLSRPGSRRPRWRIPRDAVAEYEATHGPSPPRRPRQRRKRTEDVVEFY